MTTTEMTAIDRAHAAGLSLVEQAGAVEVVDAGTSDLAGRLLMRVKAQITQIEDARKEITRPLDEAKKRAMDQEKAAKRPYEEAKQHLDGQILGFALAERKRVQQEQAEAEAERARLENEAQAAAEEGRLSDAADLQIQRDMTGSVEKAHRAAGTQARFTWVGKVTNLEDLILAVASGDAPSNLLTVNQTALNDYARATGGKQPIKGVVFVERPSLASTARA